MALGIIAIIIKTTIRHCINGNIFSDMDFEYGRDGDAGQKRKRI